MSALPDPRRDPSPKDESGRQEDLVSPLTPVLREIYSVLDRIKRSSHVEVLDDSTDIDEHGLDRVITLAPRYGHEFDAERVNRELAAMAPEGADVDQMEKDDPNDCASFSVETVIGTARTAKVIEISDPDLQDVWENFGGSVGEPDEDREDVTYTLTILYFSSAQAAQRHLDRGESD